MSDEYLTMAEIEAKYPGQWVLLDRPKTDRFENVLGGRVLFGSEDKAAVYDRMKELPQPFDVAVWFVGAIPEDVVFLL